MNGIKCKIIISEPWNFRNSIDNGNYLRGHVRQLTTDILLLESDTEELINGEKGKWFLLRNRHKKISEVYNGAMIKGYNDKWDVQTLEQNSTFVFIGHLYKE